MARDLGLFLGTFEVVPEPGLDATDPRLDDLVELARLSRYDAVADRVEQLAREGIYDVRVLVYYLYQAFREGGLAELGRVFEVVAAALGRNFEATGPAKRRQDHFDKRLSWLFQTIVDTLEYHEKHVTPEWDALHAGLAAGHGALAEALGCADRVASALRTGAYAGAQLELGRLAAWLRRRAEALASRPAAPDASGAEAARPAGDDTSPAVDDAWSSGRRGPKGDAEPRLPSQAGSAVAVVEGGPARVTVELVVSHHFMELAEKLRAFEILVEKRREFSKAAVVADDLQGILERFDPRMYFPELFSRYSALLSENIGSLAEHLEDRDSLARKALDQFYRVDLKRFVGD